VGNAAFLNGIVNTVSVLAQPAWGEMYLRGMANPMMFESLKGFSLVTWCISSGFTGSNNLSIFSLNQSATALMIYLLNCGSSLVVQPIVKSPIGTAECHTRKYQVVSWRSHPSSPRSIGILQPRPECLLKPSFFVRKIRSCSLAKWHGTHG